MRQSLIACLFLAACASAPTEAPRTPDERTALEELRDTLARIEETTTLYSESGRASTADVLEATLARLEVEERLATTGAGRRAVLELRVAAARNLEQRTEAQHAAGRTTDLDVLRARALRLEAEVDLLAHSPR